MADRNDASDGEAIALASAFENKYVYIRCHPNRYLHVPGMVKSTTNVEKDETVKTVGNRQLATCVIIERLAPQEEARFGKSGLVSFRVLSSNAKTSDHTPTRYLTVELYGDEIRQAAAASLVSASEATSAPLLPEHVPDIIDYAFGRGSAESNFEGRGFDYSPLTAPVSQHSLDARPNMMQVFQLTSEAGGGRYNYGIKSLFNTYWRSQHWAGVVSQSPHCLADEKFDFHSALQREGVSFTTRDW